MQKAKYYIGIILESGKLLRFDHYKGHSDGILEKQNKHSRGGNDKLLGIYHFDRIFIVKRMGAADSYGNRYITTSRVLGESIGEVSLLYNMIMNDIKILHVKEGNLRDIEW